MSTIIQQIAAKISAMSGEANQTYLLPDDFAQSLGYADWLTATAPTMIKQSNPPLAIPNMVHVPPPPHGTLASTGPSPVGSLHQAVIHSHTYAFHDTGHVDLFSGSHMDPLNPQFHAQVGANIAHSFRTHHIRGNVHELTSTAIPAPHGLSATMTYHGRSGWKVDVAQHSGGILGTTRIASTKKSDAILHARDQIAIHHANAIAQYGMHHRATVQNVQAQAAHVAAQSTWANTASQATPNLGNYTSSLNHLPSQGNHHRMISPGGVAGHYHYNGRGYKIEVHDPTGNIVATHRIVGTGKTYATQATAMAMYNHEHGGGITIPSGAGPQPPGVASSTQNASLAFHHAGVTPAHIGVGATAPPSPSPATPSTPNHYDISRTDLPSSIHSSGAWQRNPISSVLGESTHSSSGYLIRHMIRPGVNSGQGFHVYDAAGHHIGTHMDAPMTSFAGQVENWADEHAANRPTGTISPPTMPQRGPAAPLTPPHAGSTSGSPTAPPVSVQHLANAPAVDYSQWQVPPKNNPSGIHIATQHVNGHTVHVTQMNHSTGYRDIHVLDPQGTIIHTNRVIGVPATMWNAEYKKIQGHVQTLGATASTPALPVHKTIDASDLPSGNNAGTWNRIVQSNPQGGAIYQPGRDLHENSATGYHVESIHDPFNTLAYLPRLHHVYDQHDNHVGTFHDPTGSHTTDRIQQWANQHVAGTETGTPSPATQPPTGGHVTRLTPMPSLPVAHSFASAAAPPSTFKLVQHTHMAGLAPSHPNDWRHTNGGSSVDHNLTNARTGYRVVDEPHISPPIMHIHDAQGTHVASYLGGRHPHPPHGTHEEAVAAWADAHAAHTLTTSQEGSDIIGPKAPIAAIQPGSPHMYPSLVPRPHVFPTTLAATPAAPSVPSSPSTPAVGHFTIHSNDLVGLSAKGTNWQYQSPVVSKNVITGYQLHRHVLLSNALTHHVYDTNGNHVGTFDVPSHLTPGTSINQIQGWADAHALGTHTGTPSHATQPNLNAATPVVPTTPAATPAVPSAPHMVAIHGGNTVGLTNNTNNPWVHSSAITHNRENPVTGYRTNYQQSSTDIYNDQGHHIATYLPTSHSLPSQFPHHNAATEAWADAHAAGTLSPAATGISMGGPSILPNIGVMSPTGSPATSTNPTPSAVMPATTPPSVPSIASHHLANAPQVNINDWQPHPRSGNIMASMKHTSGHVVSMTYLDPATDMREVMVHNPTGQKIFSNDIAGSAMSPATTLQARVMGHVQSMAAGTMGQGHFTIGASDVPSNASYNHWNSTFPSTGPTQVISTHSRTGFQVHRINNQPGGGSGNTFHVYNSFGNHVGTHDDPMGSTTHSQIQQWADDYSSKLHTGTPSPATQPNLNAATPSVPTTPVAPQHLDISTHDFPTPSNTSHWGASTYNPASLSGMNQYVSRNPLSGYEVHQHISRANATKYHVYDANGHHVGTHDDLSGQASLHNLQSWADQHHLGSGTGTPSPATQPKLNAVAPTTVMPNPSPSTAASSSPFGTNHFTLTTAHFGNQVPSLSHAWTRSTDAIGNTVHVDANTGYHIVTIHDGTGRSEHLIHDSNLNHIGTFDNQTSMPNVSTHVQKWAEDHASGLHPTGIPSMANRSNYFTGQAASLPSSSTPRVSSPHFSIAAADLPSSGRYGSHWTTTSPTPYTIMSTNQSNGYHVKDYDPPGGPRAFEVFNSQGHHVGTHIDTMSSSSHGQVVNWADQHALHPLGNHGLLTPPYHPPLPLNHQFSPAHYQIAQSDLPVGAPGTSWNLTTSGLTSYYHDPSTGYRVNSIPGTSGVPNSGPNSGRTYHVYNSGGHHVGSHIDAGGATYVDSVKRWAEQHHAGNPTGTIAPPTPINPASHGAPTHYSITDNDLPNQSSLPAGRWGNNNGVNPFISSHPSNGYTIHTHNGTTGGLNHYVYDAAGHHIGTHIDPSGLNGLHQIQRWAEMHASGTPMGTPSTATQLSKPGSTPNSPGHVTLTDMDIPHTASSRSWNTNYFAGGSRESEDAVSGYRVRKDNSTTGPNTNYYVHDAQGNHIATYTPSLGSVKGHYQVEQWAEDHHAGAIAGNNLAGFSGSGPGVPSPSTQPNIGVHPNFVGATPSGGNSIPGGATGGTPLHHDISFSDLPTSNVSSGWNYSSGMGQNALMSNHPFTGYNVHLSPNGGGALYHVYDSTGHHVGTHNDPNGLSNIGQVHNWALNHANGSVMGTVSPPTQPNLSASPGATASPPAPPPSAPPTPISLNTSHLASHVTASGSSSGGNRPAGWSFSPHGPHNRYQNPTTGYSLHDNMVSTTGRGVSDYSLYNASGHLVATNHATGSGFHTHLNAMMDWANHHAAGTLPVSSVPAAHRAANVFSPRKVSMADLQPYRLSGPPPSTWTPHNFNSTTRIYSALHANGYRVHGNFGTTRGQPGVFSIHDPSGKVVATHTMGGNRSGTDGYSATGIISRGNQLTHWVHGNLASLGGTASAAPNAPIAPPAPATPPAPALMVTAAALRPYQGGLPTLQNSGWRGGWNAASRSLNLVGPRGYNVTGLFPNHTSPNIFSVTNGNGQVVATHSYPPMKNGYNSNKLLARGVAFANWVSVHHGSLGAPPTATPTAPPHVTLNDNHLTNGNLAHTWNSAPLLHGGDWEHTDTQTGYRVHHFTWTGNVGASFHVYDQQGNHIASYDQMSGGSAVGGKGFGTHKHVKKWAEDHAAGMYTSGIPSPSTQTPIAPHPQFGIPVHRTFSHTDIGQHATPTHSWNANNASNFWDNLVTGYKVHRVAGAGNVTDTSNLYHVYDGLGHHVGTLQNTHANRVGAHVQAWADMHHLNPNTAPGVITPATQPRLSIGAIPSSSTVAPTAAPVAPTAPTLNIPQNPGVPGTYNPPAPKLTRSFYAHKGDRNSTGALDPHIDYSTIDNFSDDESNLPSTWSKGQQINTGDQIKNLHHSPTGHTIQSYFTGPITDHGGAGDTGKYAIKVIDNNRRVVSTYQSSYDRDRTYIAKRAVQMAHWLDGELPGLTPGPATIPDHPIGQFSHYYAAHNGTLTPLNGATPFSNEKTARQDPTNIAKVGAYLSTTWPALSNGGTGSQQHAPHVGFNPVQHTQNILHPGNLRTAGLSDRDAELHHLAMVYHDVGKRVDAKDPEHPRLSVKDAEHHLWQFGLNPEEHLKVSQMIEWHDAFGTALQHGAHTADIQTIVDHAFKSGVATDDATTREAKAKNMADLLHRAWQSDISTIMGLVHPSHHLAADSKIKGSGSIHPDTDGQALLQKVNREIEQRVASGNIPAAPTLLNQPVASTHTSIPSLIAPGVHYGELVQRHENIRYGEQTPYRSIQPPPQEVYDEAKRHPDLSYARAFHMAYDGPTGHIVKVWHGHSGNPIDPILHTGLKPGGTNMYGKGIYTTINGYNRTSSGHNSSGAIMAEYHTGRSISTNDVDNKLIPQWKRDNPRAYQKTPNTEDRRRAAALAYGYSTIVDSYGSNQPMMVALDPARLRIITVTDTRGRGYIHTTPSGQTTQLRHLTPDELNMQHGSSDYYPVRNDTPHTYEDPARTS